MASAALLNTFQDQLENLLSIVRRAPLGAWKTLAIAIALLWACYSLARLVWIFLPAPALPMPAELVVQDLGASAGSGGYSVDLEALQSQQIFGDAAELQEEQPAVVEARPGIEANAAKTKLNLKLAGVFVSSDPAESMAIIAKGSDQEFYQVDDKLPAGANVSLAKVLSDRVILSNAGKYESLWLYSESDFKVSASAPSTTTSTRPKNTVKTAPKIEQKVSASEIPESIRDVVRFSVHREDGQMKGFKIRPGKNKDLFEQLGLQANDIVTAVNGIPVDNAQAIRDNYQQLKKATSADLEILRGEDVIYINVSLDSLSE